MQLFIENETSFVLEEKIEEAMKKALETGLEYEGFKADCEISLLIVDNEHIRQLNKRFRDIDRPTDVLSFPQQVFTPGAYDEFADEKCIVLGDIIISYEKAVSQAKEFGHSALREFSFLCVHSLLHLLGYDHIGEAEEHEMFSRQDEILLKAGIVRGGEDD